MVLRICESNVNSIVEVDADAAVGFSGESAELFNAELSVRIVTVYRRDKCPVTPVESQDELVHGYMACRSSAGTVRKKYPKRSLSLSSVDVDA